MRSGYPAASSSAGELLRLGDLRGLELGHDLLERGVHQLGLPGHRTPGAVDRAGDADERVAHGSEATVERAARDRAVRPKGAPSSSARSGGTPLGTERGGDCAGVEEREVDALAARSNGRQQLIGARR